MTKRRLTWKETTPAGQANIALLQQLQDEGAGDIEIARRFRITITNLHNARARLVKKSLIDPRVKHKDDKKRGRSCAKKRSEYKDDLGTRIKKLKGVKEKKYAPGLFDLSDEKLLFYADNPIEFITECVYWNDKLIKLDENQREWLNDKGEFRISNKSTRIGITFMCCLEALHEALFDPGSVNLFVSTTEKRAKEQLETIYEFVDGNPKLFRGVLVERPKDCARWSTGSKTYSLPNSPSGVRGIPQKGAIHSRIDEFAHFLGDEDKNMYAAMLRNLTLYGGRISIWSTPFGKRGLFYDIWRNRDNMYPDFKRHKLHYSKCPRATPESLARIKKNTHPIQWRQEFENEFVSTGEELFPVGLLHRCISKGIEEDGSTSDNPYYFGIDFALGGGDNVGIIIVEGIETDGTMRYIVRKIVKLSTESIKFLAEHIVNLIEHFNPVKIWCDETGMGRPLVKVLHEFYNLEWLVEGLVFTNTNKDTMIMRLWSLFQDGRIEIPPHDELMIQLNGLQTVETKTGRLRYDHIVGQHDDLVWAFTLAVYEDQGRWSGRVDIGMPYEGLVSSEMSDDDIVKEAERLDKVIGGVSWA